MLVKYRILKAPSAFSLMIFNVKILIRAFEHIQVQKTKVCKTRINFNLCILRDSYLLAIDR